MATMEISKPAFRVESTQMSLVKILWMFAWPAAWYTFLIYGLGRPWVPAGGFVPTWYLLTVMSLGGGAELAVGLILLRKEGYQLSLSALRDRLRLLVAAGLEELDAGGGRVGPRAEPQHGNDAAQRPAGIRAGVCPARLVASCQQSHRCGQQRGGCIPRISTWTGN